MAHTNLSTLLETNSPEKLNELFHNELVCFKYPAQGQGMDISRTLTFKAFKVNKKNEVYLSCLEHVRDGVHADKFKNFTICKVADFSLSTLLDKLVIWVSDKWCSLVEWIAAKLGK